MKTTGMLQAVTVLVVVSVATGCAATKEYSSKLFAPKDLPAKDSQAVAIRFLELDKLESTDQGWVDTKVIKDSVWKETTGSGDAIVKQPPVENAKETETQPTEPIAKSTPVNGTRNKSTRNEK